MTESKCENYRAQPFYSNHHNYGQIQKNDEPILEYNNKLSFSLFIPTKNLFVKFSVVEVCKV